MSKSTDVDLGVGLVFSLGSHPKEVVLVFVLAAFCWTISLLCNVAAFTGMLFYSESTLQL
jgi:hypothetical protein